MGNDTSKQPPLFLSKEHLTQNCGTDLNSPKCKAFRVGMIFMLIFSISIGLGILFFLFNVFEIQIKTAVNTLVGN